MTDLPAEIWDNIAMNAGRSQSRVLREVSRSARAGIENSYRYQDIYDTKILTQLLHFLQFKTLEDWTHNLRENLFYLTGYRFNSMESAINYVSKIPLPSYHKLVMKIYIDTYVKYRVPTKHYLTIKIDDRSYKTLGDLLENISNIQIGVKNSNMFVELEAVQKIAMKKNHVLKVYALAMHEE